MSEPLAIGWYVIRRGRDVACLYHAGGGWWAMCGSKRRGLPAGWTLGPSIDDLLDEVEGISCQRRDADPRTEVDG